MNKKLIMPILASIIGAAFGAFAFASAQHSGCYQVREDGECKTYMSCSGDQLFNGTTCVDPPSPEEPPVEVEPPVVVQPQTAALKRACSE